MLLAPAAHAASAPDAGTPWEPAPASRPVFGTKPPADDPARQRKVVEAGDGVDLYVETWLPAARDGRTPPERVPTVLIATPYVQQDTERYTTRNRASVVQWFTQRGYAVAQHHIRGTGESGGCLEQTAEHQIDDVARIIEYLGRDAPWADGNVGMYGISYDGETQVSTAGRGDPAKTRYLKAIVPAETVAGQYEYSNRDGVPFAGMATLSNAGYLATTSISAQDGSPDPVHLSQKAACVPELFAGGADPSGDMTAFWRVREYRPDVGNIRAATLWLHGFADFNVQAVAVAGYFDRMPATTPRAGIFGHWEHNYPDNHNGVAPAWARFDHLDMVTAWYDRWLKGVDTGVERWPAVQVQGSDGQWRVEPDFPATGGPVGQLALGPDGLLGGAAPGAATFGDAGQPGAAATFETPKLGAPLHLVGEAVADLWLAGSASDAHLVARLDALGADGNPLVHEGANDETVSTYGYRSLRHLDPMPDRYFVQAAGKPAPAGESVRVHLRFLPTDIVVPAGGALRLTLGGDVSGPRGVLPSGANATLELAADCAKPSVLRFLMARPAAPLLDVRETDQRSAALTGGPAPARVVDGGGLASAPVCGRGPERVAQLGPEGTAGMTVGERLGLRTGGVSGDGPGAGCRLSVNSLRVRLSARRARASGRAARCARRVEVSIARESGEGKQRRCRFLGASGRLGKSRSCARTVWRRARGVTRWSFSVRARLQRGRYLVGARATDGGAARGLVRAVRIRRR